MEPIFKESGKLKGTEVLFFDDVELTKAKSDNTSFASIGTLSVLYFKDYDRFILHLNDWRYPLMRRIPITSNTQSGTFTLSLPALNGFTYTLKFPNTTNSSAFSNFETILLNNSGYKLNTGESKKLDASPDDKLTRPTTGTHTGPSVTEKLTEVIKHGVDKVKHAGQSLKPGTKNLNTTKHPMKLQDIKNKNFKKEAHSTIKKDFFEKEEDLTKKFSELRMKNTNLQQVRPIDDLRKTSDSTAPTFYLWKEEVEESILNNKDLIQQRSFVSTS